MTTSEALERFPRQPYESQLAGAGLGAFRIGVLREMWRDEPRHGEGLDIMDRLLGLLRREGAILVDPVLTGIDLQEVATLETGQSSATSYELIPALNAYFARLGPDAPYRTVEQLIESAGVDRLKGRFREALSLPPPEQSDYYLARLQAQAMLRDALIDVLGRHRLDALLLPYSLVGASRVGETRVDGTNSLASHAGLPSVVVPAGHTAAGLPIAAQLIARPFAETTLLQLGAPARPGRRRREAAGGHAAAARRGTLSHPVNQIRADLCVHSGAPTGRCCAIRPARKGLSGIREAPRTGRLRCTLPGSTTLCNLSPWLGSCSSTRAVTTVPHHPMRCWPEWQFRTKLSETSSTGCTRQRSNPLDVATATVPGNSRAKSC